MTMNYDPIATRYAQAAFEVAREQGRVEETLELLKLIGLLLKEQPELRQLLQQPGIDPGEKVSIFDRALKGQWSDLVRAFVQVVLSFGRAELFEEMIGAFEEAVDNDAGRLHVLVRSARPLLHDVLERLREGLAAREHKEIVLRTELDPALVGGLQIVMKNQVFDSSVKRQLVDLRQRLTSIRVH